MVVAIAFILMTVFFLAGLYVAGALGSLALILMEVFSENPLSNIMANRAWDTYTRFLLVAIPLFILMGELVLRSGIADRMYRALDRWVAPIPGGLLHTNIVSCAIFAACSGSSISTAATISRVALPTFHTRGYNDRLVVGSLAAGGTLGILIPPSVLLVIYGLSTGTSIGRLFLAGFIPGALMALTFMILIGICVVIWPGIAPKVPGETFLSWRGWVGADNRHHCHCAGGHPDSGRAGLHIRGHRHPRRSCGHRRIWSLHPRFPLQLQAAMGAGGRRCAAERRTHRRLCSSAVRAANLHRSGGVAPGRPDLLPGLLPGHLPFR